ncbi:hypothetical protein BJ546DRAFT_948944 [Cryomyces antarcticus]|nr:hypothetical protein LTR39_002122 [Cryomyces antarcticus]
MSFLNSVLSSIGGNGQTVTPSPTAAPSAGAKPPSQLQRDNRPAGGPPANGSTIAPPKRRAEDQAEKNRAKVPRTEPTGAVNRPATQPLRPPVSSTPLTSQASFLSTPLPNRSAANSSAFSSLAASKSAQRPLVAQPSSTPTSTTTAAAPKRGYQATLERAKAAQEAQTAIGVIKHKPVEKLTKRERLALQAEAAARNKQSLGKDRKTVQDGRLKSADQAGSKTGETLKDRRKPLDLGYKGTMRPAATEPAYKGTMRSSGSSSALPRRSGYEDRSHSASLAAKPREKDYRARRGYSDDELDEEEEEDDYESDFSDMEAGAFDVDEEEALSAQIARKEDAEALKEETALKREKLERKRRMEALAAKASAKKH